MSNRYWNMKEEEKQRLDSAGCDWNLYSCLEHNSQNEFELSDIRKVLANIEGEHDGANYYWVLELLNGTYVSLSGGCDYTGWDCQSWASSSIYDDPLSACEDSEDLLSQVRALKKQTWHEKMDIEFGVKNLPKIYPTIESDDF